MTQFKINNTNVGVNFQPYIIAEVGQAHDGSLGLAHSYIDIAAEVGVNAIKFQTHIAEEESTLDEKFRVNFSYQDASRFDYWRRMEFTEEQWIGLYQHAKEKNIDFLSSAFSIKAFELLERLNLPAWKVGSGEFKSNDLLDKMINTHKPILVSTGMSSYFEIDKIYNYLFSKNVEFALFQCTSLYPTPSKYIGINVISELLSRYNIPIGFSDHSGGVIAPLYAISCGASIIESHIVFDKNMFGPDAKSSLNIEEFKFLVNASKEINEMKINPVDKDAMAVELSGTRELFTKSIGTIRDIEIGELLTRDLLTSKKPGTGIPLEKLEIIIGKKAKRKIFKNKLLSWEDLEN